MSSSTNQIQPVPIDQLADRFKKLTVKTKDIDDEQEFEKVQHMTLEELSREQISFGNTYVGRPFPSMMANTRYVTWFVGNYKDSKKANHAKFIRYIQLYVADLEKNPQQVKSKAAAKPKKMAAPPPHQGYYAEKALGPPTPPEISSEEEFDPMDPLPSGSWEEVDPSPSHVKNVEMQNMQERLHRMEEVMQQVLHHLSQPSQLTPGK